ncbi:MAG TPA: VOC family protein [Candidatus Binatia bacterium]|nr:VOC family protein [Candidatus Binatia bacterium]
MQVNPHLTFKGECEAAFRFYERCLGGKIVAMMTYGESPMAGETEPARRDRILHATLALGEYRITGGDVPAENYEKPQGFSVFLNVDSAAEAVRIFNALAQGGRVQIAMRETFWAQRFGMLVDRFGTPWLINCRRA